METETETAPATETTEGTGRESVISLPPPPPEAIEFALVTETNDDASRGKVHLTEKGLTVIGELSYEEWFQLLTLLKRFERTYHLALADTISFGRLHFGELKVSGAVQQLEFDLSDANRGYTIGAIAPEIRALAQEGAEFGLNSEHFFILGKMLPEDDKAQLRWAQTSFEQKLTGLELKKSIESGKVIRMTEVNRTSGRDSGIPNIQGLTLWFSRWEKQVGGRAAIMAWTPDLKRAWLAEVHDIVELALELEKSLGPDPAYVTSADAPGAPEVVA